ncbi:hypothetical protein AOLI_G00321310 [Acnodon oligacanthus]
MRNCSARCVRHGRDVTESEAFAARPRVASREEEGTTVVTVSVRRAAETVDLVVEPVEPVENVVLLSDLQRREIV